MNLLIAISILVTSLYDSNKKSQYKSLIKTLDNFYFQKSISKITSELNDRYGELKYVVKQGDNYESIINQLEISKNEKQIFLETIKKNKDIKILRPNQKINIKIDKRDEPKIIEFIVELNKKKRDLFYKRF